MTLRYKGGSDSPSRPPKSPGPGPGGRPTRPFELTDWLIQAIEERDTWLGEMAARAHRQQGVSPKEAQKRLASPWLFPDRHGRAMGPAAYRGALRSCYTRLGLRSMDIYAFRHAFATRWLTVGGDIHHLAAAMGTSISEIEATYGHAIRGHQREVLVKMGMWEGLKPSQG